jgi:radical SAM superfamily enzyme YgiQ (UPF0313 family)
MPIRFALISVLNSKKKFALNKDLNGGFGTADDYKGKGVIVSLARYVKKHAVRLPVLSFAYLQAILRLRSFYVKYFEGVLPDIKNEDFDVILFHGTIVDYRYECQIARRMKIIYPEAKIGFFGSFPTVKPEFFNSFDFVIQGEIEEFFLNHFRSLEDLSGNICVGVLSNLDDLPTPDLSGFLLDDYSYSLLFSRKRFMTLISSKGCPYDCRYYCGYGQLQGREIRQRSATKVIEDIKVYVDKYSIHNIQFRDPVFGLKKGFIEEFCKGIRKSRINISWGMETRLEVLNKHNLQLMKESGLKHINIGIETFQEDIADKNHRKLIKHDFQKEITDLCRKLGIRVAAFYIFGLEGEKIKDMIGTLKYAKKLNTPVARFSIITPYPGTAFFEDLKSSGRIISEDFEQYTQFNLAFVHPGVTPSQAEELLRKAYFEYYVRPSYFIEAIQDSFRKH